MALSTLPFTKGPPLSFGDRVELGVATAEKVLNALGNIPVINIVSGVLKISLATTQLIGGSTLAALNEITYFAKRIFNNELVLVEDEARYLWLQDRLKKHLEGACQSFGRGILMVITFANAFFYKLDSQRFMMKDVEQEDSNIYYPSERKVLLHRLKEDPTLKDSLSKKYFNKAQTDTLDKVEHYLNGIKVTFNYAALIPSVNIFTGSAHVIFGIAHLVASLSIGTIFKLGEAFSTTPEMHCKMRNISKRYMQHGIMALSHIWNGLFEISYAVNYICIVLKINYFTYKGYKKISANILTHERHLFKDKIRNSNPHKFLRIMERQLASLENKILNPLGKIPVVSILTGTVRIIIGIAQEAFGFLLGCALYITKQFCFDPNIYWNLDVMQGNLLEFALHGIMNASRGFVEYLPFAGKFFDNHDLQRLRAPRSQFHYYAEITNGNFR